MVLKRIRLYLFLGLVFVQAPGIKAYTPAALLGRGFKHVVRGYGLRMADKLHQAASTKFGTLSLACAPFVGLCAWSEYGAPKAFKNNTQFTKKKVIESVSIISTIVGLFSAACWVDDNPYSQANKKATEIKSAELMQRGWRLLNFALRRIPK